MRPKSMMKNKPATTGEIAKGKSIKDPSQALPGKSYLVKSQAEASPKMVFKTTAATVASKVRYKAFKAKGSVTACQKLCQPCAKASRATSTRGNTSISRRNKAASPINNH